MAILSPPIGWPFGLTAVWLQLTKHFGILLVPDEDKGSKMSEIDMLLFLPIFLYL